MRFSYWRIFRNSVEKLQVCARSDKKGNFTKRRKYINIYHAQIFLRHIFLNINLSYTYVAVFFMSLHYDTRS